MCMNGPRGHEKKQFSYPKWKKNYINYKTTVILIYTALKYSTRADKRSAQLLRASE